MDKTRFKIEELIFDQNGLIPAIVIDEDTKEILMLAYMTEESLNISIEKELTCFWSRSREELWLKGETSGNLQHIVRIVADCDRDALSVYVRKDGPACHLGNDSCFSELLYDSEEPPAFSINDLSCLIEGRKINKIEGSYTTYLFEKGLTKILKKVGEETTEVVIAAMSKVKEDTVYEISDLVYHLLVLMAEMEISLQDVRDELASRYVSDDKAKQEY